MTNLNFTTFPILTTERLTLRQLSLEDKEAIFALRTDPAINKYLNKQLCKTTEPYEESPDLNVFTLMQ